MSFSTCYIKNIDTVNHSIIGKELVPNEEYQIPDEKRISAASNSDILDKISQGKLQIGNGATYLTTTADQINRLKDIDLVEIDDQGRQIVKAAAATKGWTYLAHSIEIESSKLNSLYSKDVNGTDMPGITLKFYNSSDVELTAGTQIELDSNCVKTVIHFAPPYDFEIIGGNIHQDLIPSSDVRIWVEGGIFELGSAYTKSMVNGLNFKYIGVDDHITTDGRASKYMQKDITGVPYQGNQMKFTLKHGTGVKHKIMVVLEYFRA